MPTACLKAAILSCIAAFSCLGAAWAQEAGPSGQALADIMTGHWEVVEGEPGSEVLNCDTTPTEISVDWPARRYQVTQGEFTRQASILASGPGWMHIAYDGEPRLDDHGETQTWYWIYIDFNTFVWVRNDWVTDQRQTAPRVRCHLAMS